MRAIEEIEIICDICGKKILLSFLENTLVGPRQEKEINDRLKEIKWKICHQNSKIIDCCPSCKGNV